MRSSPPSARAGCRSRHWAVGDLVVAVKLELNVRPIELKSVPKILARCVEALETWGLILPLPNFVLSPSFIVPQGADSNG
jgi:hypothetical protein